jgi:hypothetical protein
MPIFQPTAQKIHAALLSPGAILALLISLVTSGCGGSSTSNGGEN